jgi:hypothetical protein
MKKYNVKKMYCYYIMLFLYCYKCIYVIILTNISTHTHMPSSYYNLDCGICRKRHITLQLHNYLYA